MKELFTNFLTIIGVLIVLAIIIFIVCIIIAHCKKDKPTFISDEDGILWRDKDRNFLGFSLNFIKYSLSDNRLFIQTGLINTTENEIRLYRILDLKLKRTLMQRLFGVGTITICSSDKSLTNFSLKNIRHSRIVKEQLSTMIEQQRDEKRVVNREIMTSNDDDDDNVDNS